MERWRKILGGAYEVSTEGRVRRMLAAQGTQIGTILQPVVRANPEGKYPYLFVNLSVGGARQQFRVHRLVAEAFLGPCPDGLCVNHRDGDSFNNRLENLEYVTPKGNAVHASENGLLVCGEDHASAKVTEQDVKDIRHKYYGERKTIREICEEYDLTPGTVHPMLQFKTWKHVPSRYTKLAGRSFGSQKRGKLTEFEVREIRRKYAEGTILADLSREYGIKPPAMHSLVTGKTWKHVK